MFNHILNALPFLLLAGCYTRMSRSVKRVCNKPLAKGLDEMIYIGMKDEQQIAATYDAANPLIITDLAFKAGEKLYAYEGKNYSNSIKTTMNVSEFDTTYPQVMQFLVFSNDPAVEAELMKMATRKDLVIMFKRTSGYFKIMGMGAGAKMTALEQDPNAENKGAWVVTITAGDEVNIPHTFIHKTAGLEDTLTYVSTNLVAADA